MTRRPTSSLDALKSRDGHVITESHQQILNQWKEYCAKLYSDSNVRSSAGTILRFYGFHADLPFRTEVKKALRKLKKAKAPGFDDVPVELLQAGGDATVDVLHKPCENLAREGIARGLD